MMTLSKLIKKLQKLEPEYGDLPVCITDWIENYAVPSSIAEDEIFFHEGQYCNKKGNRVTGKFIGIGP